MMDMMGGMGVMMLVVLLAAAVLIGAAVYFGVRAAGRGDSLQSADPEPYELLERRLAEGQITPEEFYERESVLRGSNREPTRR